MNDFDRDFANLNRLFTIVFVTIFAIIVATWCFYGYVAYKGIQLLSDPKTSAHSLGETVREFEKGYHP